MNEWAGAVEVGGGEKLPSVAVQGHQLLEVSSVARELIHEEAEADRVLFRPRNNPRPTHSWLLRGPRGHEHCGVLLQGQTLPRQLPVLRGAKGEKKQGGAPQDSCPAKPPESFQH